MQLAKKNSRDTRLISYFLLPRASTTEVL